MPESDWAETLPPNCPPNDAQEPSGQRFYRFAEMPLTDAAFHSQRRLFPNAHFHTNECKARSASVFEDLQAAKNAAKIGTNKNLFIVQVTLPEGCGLIKQTGQNRFHWSWWRKRSFDVLSHGEPVEM